MELADVFGYLGILTGISFQIPQVLKTYKTRSVEDLSWGMLVLFFFNCIFWGIYGVLLNGTAMIIANVIALAVNTILITLKIRYRNNP